jgi:hypothetical protein
MSETILDLDQICGKNIYSRDDGRVLYDRINKALKSVDKVIVTFNEKEIASESFLDEAIVEHYLNQQAVDVTNRLILSGVTKPDQILLGRIFEYRKRLEAKEARKIKRQSSSIYQETKS